MKQFKIKMKYDNYYLQYDKYTLPLAIENELTHGKRIQIYNHNNNKT